MQNITNVDVELIRQPKGPTWPTVHPPLNHYQVQYKRCAAKSFKCITNPLHWLPCQSLWLWLKCLVGRCFIRKTNCQHIFCETFSSLFPPGIWLRKIVTETNCQGDKLSGSIFNLFNNQFLGLRGPLRLPLMPVSQFWQNFTISTKFHNFKQIWLKLWYQKIIHFPTRGYSTTLLLSSLTNPTLLEIENHYSSGPGEHTQNSSQHTNLDNLSEADPRSPDKMSSWQYI